MWNTLAHNVVVCPWPLGGQKGGCSLPGTSNGQADTALNQAGVWALSPVQYLIGNRFANSFNGMLFDVGGAGGRGVGLAAGRACPAQGAVGRLEGNTLHGHGRFGTYFLGNAFPRRPNASLASDGLVLPDDASCGAWTTEGLSSGRGQVGCHSALRV